MKTFTQFLEQRDPNFLTEMDRRGFLGAIGAAGAAAFLGGNAQAQTNKMTPEQKYLDSLREKSEKKIIKPEVYGVINYLSASSTSFEDLRKLGDRIYDLSASNKIKLNFYGYDGGVSFEWFDKDQGKFVKTITMDTFQRFKKVLDDLFP